MHYPLRLVGRLACCLLLLCCSSPGSLWAQQVEAIAGKPYGFARLAVPVGQVSDTTSIRIVVSDENERVFFPAVDVIQTPSPESVTVIPPRDIRGRPRIGALVERIRNAVGAARQEINPPELIRIQFLFTGEEPFHVHVDGDLQLQVDITPAQSAAGNQIDPAFLALRDSWWAGYTAQAQRQVERSDYPAIIENYLIHMLGNRYGFPIPNLTKDPKSKKKPPTDPMPTIALVAGVESLRADLHRETLQAQDRGQSQRLPIPKQPVWQDLSAPQSPPELVVEPIAAQVPPECFYIRFGSFANFMWFKQFGESRGGDLLQLAVLRGLNYQTNDRLERMLNTKTNFIGRLFGDSIISDMALIGQDLYLQEGPTLGVLFEAKNLGLLKTSMENDRKGALKQYADGGITLETIEIAGGTASLLSTPDNRVRSFMVEHKNYLLITSSRKVAERFLEVAKGAPSLAQSESFRFARLTMPVSNDYSIFAYLSSEFFRNLISPQYQIELRRRLKAIASIEIAEMATRVATQESQSLGKSYHQSIEGLIEGGYLPPAFQNRVDGSQTLRFQGAWHDSLRGARGSFLPIADVPLTDCSREEFENYQDQAAFYASKWQQTDPLMVGIRRFVDEQRPEVEQLVVESYVAPLGREKYGWLSSILGAPVQTEILLPQDDMVQAQVHLAGDTLLSRGKQDHVLFLGVKDLLPPVPGDTKGLLATLRVLKSIPGYVGTWPSPGYMDRLPFGLGGGYPDAFGFSRTLFGLWRWQANGFSVISFDRTIVEQCTSVLRPAPSPNFAQGRLRIGDLKNSQVSSFFNVLSFRRAAQACRGNLLLLDSMQQQLHIPAQDSLSAAETLLDAQLQCPLGGKYKLTEGQRLWDSTLWETAVSRDRASLGFDPENSLPNRDYRAPWLTWFRGSQLNLMQLPERLVLVGSVFMEKINIPAQADSGQEKQPSLPKMNLDLFNIPFQFFQADKPQANGEKQESKPQKERRDF